MLAFVYPGQGSQKLGMGKDFVDAFTVSRHTFDEANEALGFDLLRICTEQEDLLGLTEYTQPAILATEIAMTRALQSVYGLGPTAFAGHSLGEYTALVAAGTLRFDDALRVVHERGRLMQTAVPVGDGAMTAISRPDLPLEAVEEAIRGLRIDLANHNSPEQIVLSGRTSDVASAESRIAIDPRLGGAKLTRLPVSAPFHSRLMRPIEDPFRSMLDSVGWNASTAPAVLSNFTGTWHAPTRAAVVDALVAQVSGAVRWVDNMRALGPAARIVEVGPGRPLRAFFLTLDVRIDSVFNTLTAARLFGGPS